MNAWSTRVNAALMLGLLLLQWVNVATIDNDIVSQVSWTVCRYYAMHNIAQLFGG